MKDISSIPVYTLNKILPNKISIPIFDNSLVMLKSGNLLIYEENKIKRLTVGGEELTKLCRLLATNYKKIDSTVNLKSKPLESLQNQYELIDNNSTLLADKLLYEILAEKFGEYKLLQLKELKERLEI